MAITTIVSDLGGVLTSPLDQAFKDYAEESGIVLDEFYGALVALSLADGINPIFKLECAEITQAEFLDSLGAQLGTQLGRPVSVADFPEVWFSHLHPNTEMLALMAQLRDQGFRMGLLTNNVQEWEPLWRGRYGIDAIFPVIVDSGFVGMRKPDPRIYALTEERLGVPGSEILFVDDVDLNVEAARAAGWTAVQFTNNAETLPAVAAALVGAQPPGA